MPFWIRLAILPWLLPVALVARSEFDTPPHPLRQEAPTYPYGLRQAGLEGEVEMEYIVAADGSVINPIVVGSNNPWLERPAIDAILKWRFRPGLKDGHPVNVRVVQKISFQISWDHGGELWSVHRGDWNNLPEALRWDEPPKPVKSNYPVYPADKLVASKPGKALIRFVIDAGGQVDAAKVIEASDPEFGGAALASIDAWAFEPARKAGKPSLAMLQMSFTFEPYGSDNVPVSSSMRSLAHELRRDHPDICVARDLDGPLKPLSMRPPAFPTPLRKAGLSGQAMIEFYVDREGDAQLPRVVSASAPEFGFAAVQAVAAWRFEPPLHHGKRVIVRAQVPINYSLPGPEVPPSAAKTSQP
ncbi:MAG TPA: TonB family protein [Candidatus Didemnitutus sp.]|nr:TonB family protein [Candidatus Didemnitutus sp.]